METIQKTKPQDSEIKDKPKALITIIFVLLILVSVARVTQKQEVDLYKYVKGIDSEKLEGIDLDALHDLPEKRLKKLVRELEKIQNRSYKEWEEPCEQYALLVRHSAEYPVLGYGDKVVNWVFLYEGETWKYGKTCITAECRYPDEVYYENPYESILLTDAHFEYLQQSTGTEKEMLILERLKIYSYVAHPENINRALRTNTAPLIRPPGNKRDD